MPERQLKKYTVKEEIANSLSHGIGVIFGIISLVVLIIQGVSKGDILSIVAFSIYGACLTLMYLSSTLYHMARNPKVKSILRVFDHSSIFLFIAGTYTPVILLLLRGKIRIISLSLIWLVALGGIIFKILTYGKFDRYKFVSLGIYIGMGWITVFIIPKIIKASSISFFLWLLLGGLIYTLGTIFYSNKKIPYNHAIWHIFVLTASLAHFIGILKYLT